MGTKSKVRQHTHYFEDKETKIKKSSTFVEGGMFGGKNRYLAPNVPMKRKGTKFIADLPPGYDDRTRMTPGPDGGVIVTHPDFRPFKIFSDGRREEMVIQ